ncbi:unnamed protein product, partial [Anisakis simplex]|uniref:Similar to n=1 Tax=Anisakis simplex TaxID=6269 RepID=A0A0M3J1E9_ANISI
MTLNILGNAISSNASQWILPNANNVFQSPQTECVCVKTTAIASPDAQLQEGDCGICRIWSPHFEYLADPLHLFNDPVNVKPNVAYDVWCRLNSDPESQYDGVSPILEIHSIEAPSESQMISLCAPWAPGSLCSRIDQVLDLSLDPSSQNQQFTVESQESSAETQDQSSGRRKMCEKEHLRSILFHQQCAKQVDRRDSVWETILDTSSKQLAMSEKQ